MNLAAFKELENTNKGQWTFYYFEIWFLIDFLLTFFIDYKTRDINGIETIEKSKCKIAH